jgi:DNA repair exonuclease SbcCD nuclease subunit
VVGEQTDLSAMIAGVEPVIPLAELEGPWRYVAMGHIHKGQFLTMGGAYSGSVDRVSFGEEADRKEALLIELDDGGFSLQGYDLPARRLLTLDLGPELVHDRPDVEGAIVRVRGEITPEEMAAWDREKLQHSLLDAGAALVRVDVQVRREVRRRAETVTETLGAMDAVGEYMQVKDVPEEDRPRLTELAKGLLE